MARLTALNLEHAQGLGQAFGVSVESVEALDAGSVNSNFRLTTATGETLFGRLYEEQDQSGAQVELRLLTELHAAAIPTTLPVLPQSGQLPLHQGKPFALYRWLGGEHVCLQRVSVDKARVLGSTLAKVHLASSKLTPLPVGRFGSAGLKLRLQEIRGATSKFDADVAFIESKLAEYEGKVRESPTGLVHGDLFRDNVLWDGDTIVALLDFESASWNPFAYDVMVCILAWCYLDTFNLSTARAFIEAYAAERPLDSSERAQLLVQGVLACLRFATTRITDFEMRCPPGQTPERDYRRFLARLRELESGALSSLLG